MWWRRGGIGSRSGTYIITRRNDTGIGVYDSTEFTQVIGAPLRNGNRCQVFEVDPTNNRVAARRIGDGARAAFSGDYLNEHVTHVNAVTVHATQGATADTKLLLITNDDTGRGAERTTNDGVAVLQEALPWARHIGTPSRTVKRDNVFDRTTHYLTAVGAGSDGPVYAEASGLLVRDAHVCSQYRDEIAARERFITDMARRRGRDRGRSRDDGLEL